LKTEDRKVRSVQWGDDTHVLITYSETRYAGHVWQREMYETWVFDLTTKKQYNLMGNAGLAIAESPQVHVQDGRPVAFVEGFACINLSEGCYLTLYSVDIDSGSTSAVHVGSSLTRDYVVDDHGQPVAEANYAQGIGHWALRMPLAHQWTEVYGEDASTDPPFMIGISPDGKALEVGSRKTGEATMLAFSLADGKAVPSILAGRGDAIFSRTTGRIIGERFVGHDVSYHFFNADDQQRWNKVLAHFPAEQVEVSSQSDDGSRVVVHVIGSAHGDVYELVDLTTDQASLIGQSHRQISAKDIARVTQFVYPARDGKMIDAYLTLPSGREAENLPLVVMPHGGPEARDEPGFDWWAQALASMGYAVLQPQFRGSGDMGWDLLSAGFGEFGRKMQTDLSDGVHALAKRGIVDPRRVCIVGASYGGYAALAGATIDRGVYRCAVSVGGISNPGDMIWAGKRYEVTRYWMRYLGATGPGDPVVDAVAPLKHASSADIPILLIYGDNDSVVPIDQSKDMASELQRAGKPHSVVVLEGEDHWLSRSSTRTQMLKATVDFLKRNNPPE
jgi:dipeptidyl aminopeptidase/acylaminoacyl peptidase